MRLRTRPKPDGRQPGLSGTARVDRRTTAMLSRLRPGDIAVIDHLDMDRATAQALVDRGVLAVVNAAPFISGRYPSLGPRLLATAGVILVEGVGATEMSRLRDGAAVRLHDGGLYVGEELVLSGSAVDAEQVERRTEEARSGLGVALETFTHNTTEFLRREQDLLLHGEGVPDLRSRVAGRPVVVVARDYGYQADLRRLRRFVREQRPVLVGVDAGADVLLDLHLRPDVVVVGADGLAAPGSAAGERGQAVSDTALRQARDVVLHHDRGAPRAGADRLARLGVRAHELTAGGATVDVALLAADINGAALVVCVGTHATLDEFLDRQRAGPASTFLTRLRVGPKLVEASSVAMLYSGRVRAWQLFVVLLAALAALLFAVVSTPVGNQWWQDAQTAGSDLLDWIRGLFA